MTPALKTRSPPPSAHCRSAWDLLEPACIDLHGAEWVARGAYALHPTAKRFESYEISFASKVNL